jgi:hypothetical protein
VFFMSAKRKLTLSLLATAISASMGAWAVPLTVDNGSGPAIIWGQCGAFLCPDNLPTAAKAQAVLDGIGNVELNKFGGVMTPATPVTSIWGTFSDTGLAITLSSLVLADWTANGNALATAYITDAAAAAGLNLGAALPAALAAFFAPNATLGGLAPWMLVSDPNISYVNNDGGVIHIGLDGLIDASAFLNALNPAAPDQGAQVSEVVKVTYNGVTDYLYGFHAVPTGYASVDRTGSFTGVYEVTIPEPSAMWLLGIGLIGLLASRRR